MKTKHYYILAIVIVVVVGIGIYGYVKLTEQPVQKQNITTSTEKESCEASGGKWGRIGLSQIEECNLSTSDGGKECSGPEECEGDCIAELSPEDREKATQGVFYTKGKCTSWKITVGCQALVRDGKVEGILCSD